MEEFKQDSGSDMAGRFITFLVGRERFGISVRQVKEIVGLPPITEMPGMPGHLKGVINLRGSIIPVVDARLRFGKGQKEYDARTCVIVAQCEDMQFGLIVDSVSEVLTIPEEDIAYNPERCFRSGQGGYISGIGKTEESVIMLLDCDKLLTVEETAALAAL